MRRSHANKALGSPEAQGDRCEPELDPDEALRYIAYLLPSLVHMAEISSRPTLAYILDAARIEAGEPKRTPVKCRE